MWPRPRRADAEWRFEVEVTRKLAAPRGVGSIRRPDGRKSSRTTWSRRTTSNEIARRIPSLRALTSRAVNARLAGTEFSDSDAAVLSNYRFIHTLNLNDTNIGDATLRQLKKHFYTYDLSLASTNITDAGMGYIGRLPLLSHLDLRGTRVTDAGLLKLIPLQKLTSVDVSGSLVSEACVARLKSHFPDLTVTTGP